MARVLVPVGFSLGSQHKYVRPADPEPASWEAHVGGDIVDLADDEIGVYGAAFKRTRSCG